MTVGCVRSGVSFTMNINQGTDITLSGLWNNATYDSGTTTINDTGKISLPGNITWKPTHTHNSALGSAWTITGTSSITSVGKFRPDSVCINSSATVTAAGKFKFKKLNVVAGTFAITNHTDYDSITGKTWFSGTSQGNFTSDSLYFGSDLTGTGNHIVISDEATLWKMENNAKIIGFDTDTLPYTIFLGSGGL
jgi:hypothetical protein